MGHLKILLWMAIKNTHSKLLIMLIFFYTYNHDFR